MSIIRDLLEYYRLPSVVQLYQDDFEVGHEILNGYEERYYYDADIDGPIRMIVDQYTQDGTRFRRTWFFYDEFFIVQQITSQYDYGKKEKVESYIYGPTGEILRIDVVESDIDVTWDDNPSSTGWPEGQDSGGGLRWIYINRNQPAEHLYGYLCDTSFSGFDVILPSSPEEGDTVGIVDVKGTFSDNNVTVDRNGNDIMGLSEDLVLNENYQGLQLVFYDDNWVIVWSTPMVTNVISVAPPL